MPETVIRVPHTCPPLAPPVPFAPDVTHDARSSQPANANSAVDKEQDQPLWRASGPVVYPPHSIPAPTEISPRPGGCNIMTSQNSGADNFSPKVPPELSDMIIDMLHKDKRALKTTSLVCRNWLPASRMHLFEMVTFSPVNLPDFFSFSNSPNATLLPHIRNIVLKPPGVLPHQGQYKMWKDFTPDLHRCTAIKSVSLEYMKWNYLEPSARESFVSNLPGVTEINTMSATFANLDELLELLASYPLLEKVSLDFGLSCSSMSLRPPLHPFPPRLGTIKLGAQHTQHVLTWLQSHDTFPEVHTLDIYNIRPTEVGPLERLLKALGSQLKHLHVAFMGGSRVLSESAADIFSRSVSLKSHTSLHSIHIIGGAQEVLPNVVPILSGISSPILEKVGIAVFSQVLSNFVSREWSRIEDTLLTAPFERIGLMEVTLGSPMFNGKRLAQWTQSEAEAEVRTQLPACEKKGILVFDST